MSEDFVRCYIGDISLPILKTVQRESDKFPEWELSQGAEFDYKHSYGYENVFDRDELLLEALAKRSVIAETRQPESVKTSIIWKNANDWYQTRCALFHEGRQSLPIDVLTKRRQQVRDFTSLVLVEMLEQQDEARKKQIATRMQNY